MDVTCSNCREPWDYYHMIHDEIWETDLSEFEKKRFIENSARLDDTYRMALQKLGWRFGGSVLNIRHCPCCKESDTPNRVCRDPLKDILDDMLGDDLDGIAAMHEDYQL